MNEVLGPAGSSSFGHRADTAATLALLRVEQGRLDEAAALLEPYEDRIAACVPMARLHLSRNEPGAAAAVLRRGLGALVGDALRGATLLSLLVEAELADGDIDAARAAADRLASIAADGESPVLAAEADIAGGAVEAASGERDAAVVAYEAAQRRLATGERPLLVGLVRLELAEVFAANDDESNAVAEARAALAAFERLGATSYRDRARALLRSLGVGVRIARSIRTGAPGVVDRPRVRGPRPRTAGLQQRRHRRETVHLAQDGRAPRRRHPEQAGCPQPGRGGRRSPRPAPRRK